MFPEGSSMSDDRKTPWHLWVVGAFYLLWSAMGALDYTMTQTRNDVYMAQFTPEQLTYFYSFPSWMIAAWAVGVWGGVIGAILLLLRHRWAAPAFWLAFLAGAVGAVYTFVLAETPFSQIAGTFELVFSLVILVLSVLVIWYAQNMRARGVLR